MTYDIYRNPAADERRRGLIKFVIIFTGLLFVIYLGYRGITTIANYDTQNEWVGRGEQGLRVAGFKYDQVIWKGKTTSAVEAKFYDYYKMLYIVTDLTMKDSIGNTLTHWDKAKVVIAIQAGTAPLTQLLTVEGIEPKTAEAKY